MANESKALAIPEESKIEEIRQALQGEQIAMGDLDQIKIPAGGGQTWEVPSTEGDYSVRNLEGVIILTTTSRAYWATDFESGGGGRSPDCSSPDGIYGQGNRGIEPNEGATTIHACADCPLAFWGSGAGGGIACRENKQVFLLIEGRAFPIILRLPPTSIGVLRKYNVALASEGRVPWGVVSRFALQKVQSKSGINYSRVQIEKVRDLEKGEADSANSYVEAMEQMISTPRSRRPADDTADEPGSDLPF